MKKEEGRERYLCIYNNDAGSFNVGVFDASSRDEARDSARSKWGCTTSYSVDAFPIKVLPDGWSMY